MIINLAGEWLYELDYQDQGLIEKWYEKKLSNTGFKLPGTTASNFVGDKLDMELNYERETLRHLRQHYRYVGASWYQRKFFVPDASNKVYRLFLERVMFESRVYINGKEVGKRDSLSTPHIYDITRFVIPGQENEITIRVDNRDVQKLGPYPSAYTDETQTIWNGVIGRIEVQVLNRIYVDQVQIYPNIHESNIKGTFVLCNPLEKKTTVRVNIKVHYQDKEFKTLSLIKHLEKVEEFVEFIYDIEELHLWDEFTPNLYELEIEVEDYDVRKQRFGMREFTTKGTKFVINGKTTFLRGTLECCIFPITAHPSMERSEWERIFSVVKEYGLNHVRFHSWCPPEIAFTVADEMGLYLNVEGPVWMDNWNKTLVGQYPEHYEYLPEESLRIVDTYGNHPSFVMYSLGNELRGSFELMSDIIRRCKKRDRRHLYTLTTNWDRKVDKEDDYFAAQTVDGVPVRGQYKLHEMVTTTKLTFDEAVAQRNIPVVSHEVGQYSVYPDISEIEKYTGVLRPINFESIKKNLEEHNLIKYAKDFTLGSGKLALYLYKDELEAAIRTKGLGGIQLLDLHDFPGQSTATVGILNCFWESKGITTSDYFRKFCNAIVPLALLDKRIFLNNETLKVETQVANYFQEDLVDVEVLYEINDKEEVIFSNSLGKANIKQGEVATVGSFEINLEKVTEPKELVLKLIIKNTPYQNEWNIWVYPDETVELNDDVIHADKFDDEVIKALKEGKKVLLTPKEQDVYRTTYGKFFPVFWSPIHFISKDPCGIIANKHVIFDRFPTDRYINYQWKDIVEKSYSINIDDLPLDFEPIVQVIPNFYNNAKLANLFECKVGKGKLFVTSIDLETDIDKRITAKALRNSIYRYLNSDAFDPRQSLELASLVKVFTPKPQYELDLVDVALYKKAFASSEMEGHPASYGNDNNLNTAWEAKDFSNGQHWTVDLGQVYEIVGTKITFSEKANYLYAIQTSVDGNEYKIVVNQTGQTSTDQERFDEFTDQARFIRIVYNGLPKNVKASHKEVKVYIKKK